MRHKLKINIVIFGSLFLICSICILINSATAQGDFPRRPIHVICSWATGGGSDVKARTVASLLRPLVGVPVPVSNVPGGSGAAGLAEMLARPADGYTILNFIKSTFGMTVRDEINAKLGDDFVPLAMMNNARNWLFVHPNAPWANAQELLDYIRENPNKIVMSGESEVSDDAVIRDRWAAEEGLKIRTDWFESASERQLSVVGGHNDILNDQMGSGTVHEYVAAGRLRPILVFSDERDERFPDVQCSKEVGLIGYAHYTQWRGFVVKAGTPQAIIDYLAQKLKEVADTDEFKEYLVRYHLDPDSYKGPEEFEMFLRAQEF